MNKHNEAVAYLQLKEEYDDVFFTFQEGKLAIIIDDIEVIKEYIALHQNKIRNYKIFSQGRNYAFPLLEINNINARIEPGAIIREGVILDDNCIVLMNATINVGAHIGENTMIDMGAVIGSNAIIGKSCHIGANCVIAGTMEPPSNTGVIVEDNCFIGAGSVVLSGVKIGSNSIVGALSLVNKDVPPNSVVYGIPCRVVASSTAREKCKLNKDLRL